MIAAAKKARKGKDDTMHGLQALLHACDAEEKKGEKGGERIIPFSRQQLADALRKLPESSKANVMAALTANSPNLHQVASRFAIPSLLESSLLSKLGPIGTACASQGDAAATSMMNVDVPLAQPILGAPGLTLPQGERTVGFVGVKKRLRNACVRCKKDKVKCHSQRPCARCNRLGIECIDAIPKRIGRRRIHNGEANAAATAARAAAQMQIPMSHIPVQMSTLSGYPPLIQQIGIQLSAHAPVVPPEGSKEVKVEGSRHVVADGSSEARQESQMPLLPSQPTLGNTAENQGSQTQSLTSSTLLKNVAIPHEQSE